MAVEDLRLRASELANAYQKLAGQDWARRDFLTTVAQELRTPLMLASGYLQSLQKGMVSPDQTVQTIDNITHNIEQLTMLVNDILFLQEIELVLPEFQPVNMVEVAEKVMQKYESRAAVRQVNLKLKGDRGVPAVKGDPISLERALTGLVDNAIKFSAPNKSVEIRLMAQGDRVVISVEDQGTGIPPEIQPRIFDRSFHFDSYNGDETYTNIGIGLSVTRQVIEQHSGTLTLDSEPSKGSIFTISLLKW
jgi:signal transduction histidine kinase